MGEHTTFSLSSLRLFFVVVVCLFGPNTRNKAALLSRAWMSPTDPRSRQ